MYSIDGSTIKINDSEKYFIKQLNLIMDNILIQKTALLETLEKLIALTTNIVLHKQLLDTKFVVLLLFNHS